MPNGDTMDTSENAEVKPGESPQNGVPIEVPVDIGVDQEETQNERELSQTDHLNKSLLTSFLSRLNDPNFPIPTPQHTDESGESETQDQQNTEDRNGDPHAKETGGRGEEDAWMDRNDGRDEK